MLKDDIYKLHKKYSHGKYSEKILEIVWTHSLIVRDISLQIAADLEKKYGIKTDKELIGTGALFHDIGFYNCFDDNYENICKYLLHGKIGYDILKNENYSEEIARFALTHIGVGIENCVPISLEEEIVCHADNFHTKSHPSFNTYNEVFLEMKGFNKDLILERFKDKFGIPNLNELEKQYKKWHKEINEWVDSIK